MLNREVFHRDPLEFTIPNQGVARVERPNSPEDWQKLDYELKSFVCKGAYARGMNTILDQYLAHVDAPAQPAVWVSGFYGSGKSHFARVLEHVWRDTQFPDGETARSKVDLTKDITDKLRELSTVGKKNGGLWSAAGTLSAASSTDTVRMKLLSIIFQGAGLPTQYSRARFAM